ncbi:MAG TPA: PHB depolymerase family esterase [Candidatus Limnocylindrales bacterium]
MSESESGTAARGRWTRAARIAGLAAPVLWAVTATIEVARANIGHSIISRPERFFSDATWHWPIVLLVAATVAAQVVAISGLHSARLGRRAAIYGGATILPAAMFRLLMAIALPSDAHGYSIDPGAITASHQLLLWLPFGPLITALVLRRRSPGLAWLSAITAIGMVWVGLWAAVWSARSGASQPQLLAVEPMECLASIWAAAAGAWLFGLPQRLHSAARLPTIPAPGRKSGAALSIVMIAGIVFVTGSFVPAYRPTIESQLTGKTQVETIHADAVDRTYRVHRPSGPDASPGLVIVLHGSFGGGFQIEADSGFDVEADRLGWIAVYPDGVADGWDAFGSTVKWGRHPGADDVAFISGLIDRLEASDGVDPNRIYVTGMSRGGMMSYRLGCALSDRIAAIAPVSGNMATESGSADVPCTLAHPVSVFAIHGTSDGTIPIKGGKVDITFSPMADVIARWRSMDQCDEASTQATDGPSTTTDWACSGGSTVSTRVVSGGWHTWPKVTGATAALGGSPDSFDAARLIADFFAAHPRVAAA